MGLILHLFVKIQNFDPKTAKITLKMTEVPSNNKFSMKWYGVATMHKQNDKKIMITEKI